MRFWKEQFEGNKDFSSIVNKLFENYVYKNITMFAKFELKHMWRIVKITGNTAVWFKISIEMSCISCYTEILEQLERIHLGRNHMCKGKRK